MQGIQKAVHSVQLATGVGDLSAIPLPAGEIVVRERLLEILDRAADVTVVHALPGSGKTALVAQWARKLVGVGGRVQWTNVADTPEPVLVAMAAEFIRTGGGVLVLDDFHWLDNKALIDSLCDAAGSTSFLRLVVLTTDCAQLRAAARRHMLSVQEISGRSLLADSAELTALGTAWGHRMPASRTAALLHFTGGWLQLARLVLDSGGESNLDQDVARRFLSHHVGPGIVDVKALGVAARLSVAPEITALHVEESLQDANSEALAAGQGTSGPEAILTLEETGLLRRTRDVGGTTTWQLPELVRRVLAEDFRTYHSAQARRWHGRMAVAMFAGGSGMDQDMILHHARKGDAWRVLAGMWTRHSLLLTVRHSCESRTAYLSLPPEALDAEPVLGLAASVVSAAAKFDDGPKGYAAGQRALMQGFRAVERPTGRAARQGIPFRDQVELTVSGIIAHRSSGRFAQAIEIADAFAKRAVDVSAAGGPSEYSGRTAWFRQQRALSVLLTGDLPGARALFSAAHDCATNPGEEFIAVDAASNLALVCTLSGLPDSAWDWLGVAAGSPLDNDWLDYMVGVPGFVARALLALDSLDVDLAAVELAKAGDGSNQMELWPFIVLAATEQALLRGEAALMLSQLEMVVAMNSATFSPGSAAEQIIARCRAELLLAQEELNQAARVLDDAGDLFGWLEVPRARLQLLAGNHDRAFRLASAGFWGKETSQRDKVDLLLIKAAAAENRGEPGVAGKAFAHAVELAQTYGQLRPFRGLPAGMLLVLADRAGVDLPADAQQKVQAGPRTYPASAVMVELSPRELKVLYEMDRHETVADIAKELVVSSNTVKKQVGSIYAKLGVHDRQSALERAQLLAFLPEPR